MITDQSFDDVEEEGDGRCINTNESHDDGDDH